MITIKKELSDTLSLSEQIKADGWMDNKTIIVCCSPDYSSIMCQVLNHKLSSINKNELFEQISLEMPYPTMSQVWDRQNGEYVLFDRYLMKWVADNVSPLYSYLFLNAGCLRGKNFQKLKQAVKDRLPTDHYRFGCLYLDEESVFTPDYYVEKVEHNTLIFEWENPLNPNWNY